ncbi:metallophosphoesterase family protein [Cellulomonas humilata]|uniref:Protein phosphatase n=1 Tax=Cellulomonas humilata TaxID=144055 RepID=A0ABU0EBW2_9CELL|nr:metallophosphoesterase family protein [Cellulomonas humilata]MDQ0372753.1 protein phosphatase [Cellulomonas humilata]
MVGTVRIAVLSDVHGNLTAFDAVLADIDARGITTILNLGDVAGKGPRGSAAVARTRERCALTVRGNWDDFLPVSADHHDPAIRWWHDELTADDRDWLTNLPLSHDLEIAGRNVRLFHASATSVYTRVQFHHTDDEFAAMFASTELTGDGPEPTVVLYGDVHDAYVETYRGRTLVNVGSVGNPLDETTASYVILEGVGETFSLQIVRVPYDVEAEVAVAEAVRMPELEAWTVELRTGIYRGRHAELGLSRQE